jgi:hypothetical protein
MSKFEILLLFFLLPAKIAFAQKDLLEKTRAIDPDSSGQVNSNFLPTTMPLMLIDDDKQKTK